MRRKWRASWRSRFMCEAHFIHRKVLSPYPCVVKPQFHNTTADPVGNFTCPRANFTLSHGEGISLTRRVNFTAEGNIPPPVCCENTKMKQIQEKFL